MSISKEELQSEIENWITKQMPIIQMHGGNSVVREIDMESGTVVIELGGTCSDCGISNRTSDNMKRELYQEFEQISEVQVKTPSAGDTGKSTVDGGRGGEIFYSSSSEHL